MPVDTQSELPASINRSVFFEVPGGGSIEEFLLAKIPTEGVTRDYTCAPCQSDQFYSTSFIKVFSYRQTDETRHAYFAALSSAQDIIANAVRMHIHSNPTRSTVIRNIHFEYTEKPEFYLYLCTFTFVM
jgi:hypothetical protein